MPKKRIIILGGGISGLTLAYDLSKHQDHFQLQLIEKSDRVGGWMDTDTSTSFFFEKGPRIFRGSSCPDFLRLTQELELHQEMIESGRGKHNRYLWRDGKLRKIPKLSWNLIKGMIREWNTPFHAEDESVWDFACRRFNETVARDIFDPLVVGIYGGNAKELSMRACFPLFKILEEEHGSILKGLFRREKFKGPSMFGFERGMKSVAQRLQERSPIPFHLSEEVTSIQSMRDCFLVTTSKASYEADFLFSALPAPVIGKLLVPELLHLPMQGVTMVDLGYHQKIGKKKGLGYLVSSEEKEDVLGVIFNSNMFPHYNRSRSETRLTVMLKGVDFSIHEARQRALQAVSKHLKTTQQPQVSMVTWAPQVFPQFLVGHSARMQSLEEKLQVSHPRLRLVGNYLYGVGVNDCIARARSVVASFLRAVPS